MGDEDIRAIRERMMNSGGEMLEVVMNLSDDQIRDVVHQRGISFRDNAPTSAVEAAAIILKGVKEGKWRILVGEDANRLDERVRADPESAYDLSFVKAAQDDGDLVELINTTQE